MKRLGFLDRMRALAAMTVAISHLPQITEPRLQVPGWAEPFLLYGGAGVTLFFVISAFSLCLTMPGHLRTGATLVSFFVNRFLRIAPLFYLILAYSLTVRYKYGLPLPSPWLVLLNVTFLFNTVPAAADSLVFSGWTLGVEALFYLAFPLLDRCLPGVERRVVALLLTLAIYPVFLGLLNMLELPPGVADRFRLLTICLYLPAFMAGMLAYELSRMVPAPAGSMLIALAVLIYTLLVADRLTVVLAHAQWQAICFGSLLLGLAARSRLAFWDTIGAFLSKMSYSIYLLHGPIIVLANPIFQWIYRLQIPLTFRLLLATAAALAMILPAAWVSYQLVERPCIKLGRACVARYAAKRGNRAGVTTGRNLIVLARIPCGGEVAGRFPG